MKIFRTVAIIIIIVLSILAISIGSFLNINLSPIDKNSTKKITVVIPSGTSTKQIGEILEKEGLIRNADFLYAYLRIHKINDIKASTYELSPSMALKEIIDTLRDGNSYNPNTLTITFQEGINMRKIATIIESKTNNTASDVYAKLKDEDYLDRIIEKYWFLTNEIKNKDIYYSLEGYLYPDTYFISNRDVSIEGIFKLMLDQTDKKLTPIKNDIENSGFSVHQLLTLASIIEQEGVTNSDRKNISSVFYNRLNKKMSLGSDVTTYYAFKIDLNERDLNSDEINTYNPYNTRGPKMEGKLPVGPICIPSFYSIDSAINPSNTDYLYFVADKNRKVYFTKTYNEHQSMIKKLKNGGLWLW